MPVESILDGTWASGPAPPEWVDFVLMHRMPWSWRELQETPMYVRRYCWDFLNAIAEQEQRENDRARSAQHAHRG